MKSTRLQDYSNAGYSPGAGKFKIGLWYLINAFVFCTQLFPVYSVKCRLLRMFGARIGQGVVIKPRVNIKYPWRLVIGDHSWIGEGVWIDNLENVIVGSNVCISQNALILTGNHNYRSEHFDLSCRPISIDDGVWVGASAVICPGIHLYSHSVIAVGSIVSCDAKTNGIYRGNPASLVRMRNIDNSFY